MDEFEHLSDEELEKIANPSPSAPTAAAPTPATDEFAHMSDEDLRGIAGMEAPKPTGPQPFSASLVPNRQAVEAFGSRYLDVPTMGMATAARAGIGSLLHGTSYPEEYRRLKSIQERAQAAYPKTSTAGTVTGLGAAMLAPSAAFAPSVMGSRVLGSGVTSGITGGIETYGETGGKPGSRLADIGIGALTGAGLGMIGQRLGEAIPAIGQWAGRKIGALPKPQTVQQIKDIASDLYKQAEQVGIWIRPDKIRSTVQDLNDRLANEANFDPETHTDVARVLKKMWNDVLPTMTGMQNFMPLEKLEAARQSVNKGIMKSSDPQKKYMGMIIKDHLDDVMNGLIHTDVIGGNPQQAMNFLNQARPTWARMRRAERIEDAIDIANARADTGEDLQRALQSEIKKLAMQGARKPGMWSPQEMAAMAKVASPSMLSALAPEGKLGTAELIGLMTAIGTGNFGVAAGIAGTAAAGKAGQKIAEKMKQSAATRLMQDVGAGTTGQRPTLTKQFGQLGQAEAADIAPTGADYTADGRRIIDITRPARANGGRVSSLERQALRAHRDLAKELMPLTTQPDHVIANALRLAKG